MREILFRGKRLDTGEWVFGSLVSMEGTINPGRKYILPEGEGLALEHHGERGTCSIGSFYEVDPETVGQYIGIEDGQGQRIFEGDLITCPRYERDGIFFRVYFSTNWPGFSTEAPGQRACPGLNRGTMKSYRVAGNIYDNPQLLAAAADGAGQYGLGEVLRSAT